MRRLSGPTRSAVAGSGYFLCGRKSEVADKGTAAFCWVIFDGLLMFRRTNAVDIIEFSRSQRGDCFPWCLGLPL
jgi:hypothetical protein